MKLVEAGTFALLVLFVGGMTVTHQERLQAKKDQAKSRKETMRLEKDLREKLADTVTGTVTHDHDSETTVTYIALDASRSFDAGNAPEFHTVDIKVYDETKPKCIKWEEDCYDSRSTVLVPTPGLGNRMNNGLFEDEACECKEYEVDDCGDRVYEQECEIYDEDCEDDEFCRCVKLAWETVNYVDACEYKKLNHQERQRYVNRMVPGHIEDELTYSWAYLDGPAIDKDLFDKYKEDKVLKLELKAGDYTFECTVTDPYSVKTIVQKNVSIVSEPNNEPEVYITDYDLGGPSLDEFKAAKKEIEAAKEAEKKEKK